MSILCAVIMVIWVTVCIINAEHYEGIEDEIQFFNAVGKPVGLGFLILTILMFLSIALVIWMLRMKQKANGISKIFGKEIVNLLIILILFASSFLLRFALDEWAYSKWFKHDANALCTWEDGTLSVCHPYLRMFVILST